jgi:hypothetical protein
MKREPRVHGALIASSPLRGSPTEVPIHPSRPLGRSLVLVVAGLSLVGLSLDACGVALVPSAAPSIVAVLASPSSSPSGAPSGSPTALSPSVGPDDSPAPEPSADPAPEPSDDPGTAGPGCGTGRAGLFAHNDEVPDAIRFGGATLEYTSVGVSLRNGTYDASDSVPGGLGLTRDEIAVVVGPGDHILLRATGLTLTATSAQYVRWSTVRFDSGLGFSPAARGDLPWRVRPDGSLSVSAPSKLGDYEVEFGPRWTGTCIEGSGLAYGRVKVR